MNRSQSTYDAIVVGAGPNGLSAAVALAQAGHRVLVLEAAESIGGGARTAEWTRPGFQHDVCSAIHPLAVESPFFRQLSWSESEVDWVHSPIAVAHPMPDGTAVAMARDLESTEAQLGADSRAYHRLIAPIVRDSKRLMPLLLQPPRLSLQALRLARFAWNGIGSAARLVRRFQSEAVAGMFAGMAAHAILPLHFRPTAAVGMLFCATVHTNGWPFPRGGSKQIVEALARRVLSLGGEIETRFAVQSIEQLPASKVVLFNLSLRQVARIAGDQLPAGYLRKLERFRYGPGVFKLDYALRQPVPWTADACRRAATVHVGGSFAEIAASESDAWNDRICERPFVLVAQQSLFDETRAPRGHHTLWAYCHVPRGSTVDMCDRIESQIERFAPGFRDTVLERHVTTPLDLERYNANCLGGDISAGAMTLWQTIARPRLFRCPYSTPNPRLFLCSAATPPGPGVHGMCGYHAAQAARRRLEC